MPPGRRPVRRNSGGGSSGSGSDARRSARTVVLVLLAVALLSALYLLWDRGEGAREEAPERPGQSAAGAAGPTSNAARPPGAHADGGEEPRIYPIEEPPIDPATDPTQPPLTEGQAPAPAEGARIALVIDDLGRSLADVDTLEGLGVPISYAVLPFETKTAQVVAKLRGLGAEILLHLPMEPGSGANPGPGALRVGMTGQELADATRAALGAVPGAVGVNNHMGSRLSADGAAMSAVLGELVGRGLFFLDSRTSAASTGYATARSLGLAAAERQVFLDGDPDPEQIRFQFHRLLQVARQRGSAIAIGHPYPSTFQVLATEIPRARELGYELVRVSYLLDQPGEPPL